MAIHLMFEFQQSGIFLSRQSTPAIAQSTRSIFHSLLYIRNFRTYFCDCAAIGVITEKNMLYVSRQ